VTQSLAQMTKATVPFIDENQGLRICHNAIIIESSFVSKFVHDKNLNQGAPLQSAARLGIG
jgi:hypothetical protein